MDLFWVRNLAHAKFTDGHWRLPNAQQAKQHSKASLIATIRDIYQELVIAVNTYNQHVQVTRQIKLLPIYEQSDQTMLGFIMMIGALQMRFERKSYRLQATLESLQGFRKIQELLHEFEPRIDGLGGLSWIMDGKSIMTNEMIIKQLLHDICSTAFEMEWNI